MRKAGRPQASFTSGSSEKLLDSTGSEVPWQKISKVRAKLCASACLKPALAHNFARTLEIFCHGTSLPVESNSFSLDPDVKEAWGLPALRMTFRDHPNDLKMMEWMQARAMEILDAAGARSKWSFPVQEQQFAVHLLGTCRMGDDPKKSV